MSAGIWFWIIFVISIIFGFWSVWPFERKSGIYLVVYILIGLLGWRVFGPVVQ